MYAFITSQRNQQMGLSLSAVVSSTIRIFLKRGGGEKWGVENNKKSEEIGFKRCKKNNAENWESPVGIDSNSCLFMQFDFNGENWQKNSW